MVSGRQRSNLADFRCNGRGFGEGERVEVALGRHPLRQGWQQDRRVESPVEGERIADAVARDALAAGSAQRTSPSGPWRTGADGVDGRGVCSISAARHGFPSGARPRPSRSCRLGACARSCSLAALRHCGHHSPGVASKRWIHACATAWEMRHEHRSKIGDSRATGSISAAATFRVPASSLSRRRITQGILAWHVREGHLGDVRIPRPRNSPGIAAKLAGHLDMKFGRHPEGAPLSADLGWKRRYAPSRAGSCCRRGLPNGRFRREART